MSRLLGLMSIREMQHLQKFLTTELSLGSETQKVLEVSETSLKTISDIVANPNKTYSGLSGKLTKQLQVCITSHSQLILYKVCLQQLHSSLSVLGQLTQLRKLFCNHLSSLSMFDSKLLHSNLRTFQCSVISRCDDG